jgi:mannan endo-1,4-beta-mannosidase
MRCRQITSGLLMCLLSSTVLASERPVKPVTPDASPEAVALLKFIDSLSGKYTMSGQHNFPNDQDRHTARSAQAWGKVPAVFGKDWGFAQEGDKDSAYARDAIVEELKEQFKNGAIVTMCWHEAPPTAAEPVTFSGRGVQPMLKTVQGRLTDEQYKELLTPGTELNEKWCAQVDAIVPYLKRLEVARVPLLWRPFHEMNGTWFWWGGRRGEYGTVAMYKMMFDRIVKHHQIKNLIWIWSVDRPEGTSLKFEECWPGPEYVDILSLDCYGEFKQSYYDDLVKLANGKPVALAEVGAPPTPEVLAKQPGWTWWMTWAGMGAGRRRGGDAEPNPIQTLVNDPRSLSLTDDKYVELIAPFRQACGLGPIDLPGLKARYLSPAPAPVPATAP